jgi:hypothetical protein
METCDIHDIRDCTALGQGQVRAKLPRYYQKDAIMLCIEMYKLVVIPANAVSTWCKCDTDKKPSVKAKTNSLWVYSL